MSTALQQRLSLETELSTLTAELIEAFMEADEQIHSNNNERLLKSYINHVTRCGLAAGRCGLTTIQDFCVQFQNTLKTLLTKPADTITASRAGLEQWPLLVMAYLNSEQNSEIIAQITHLQNELDHLLCAELAAERDIPSTSNDTPHHVPTETITTTRSPVEITPADPYAALREEFENVIDLALQEELKTNSQLVAPALTACADGLALTGISLAAHSLIGLMDVVQFLQTGLRVRAEKHNVLSDAEWDYLNDYRACARMYLSTPTDAQVIHRLLTTVAQMPWIEPLPEDHYANLRVLLHIETTDLPITPTDQLTTNTNSAVIADTTQLKAVSPATIPKEYLELIQLVAAEFENSLSIITQSSLIINDTEQSTTTRQEAITEMVALLERFASVAESISLHGLQDFFHHLSRFFNQSLQVTAPEVSVQMWLAEWPAYVAMYLTNPFAASAEFVAHCTAGRNLLALNDLQLADLIAAIRNPQMNLEDITSEPRQTVAQPQDVSLTLPQDVNQQLLESLLQELPQQTADFSRAISRIISGSGNLQDVDLAQRVAHTLKGSANTVGVAGIANLTHHIEDILLAFSKAKQLPAKPLTSTLQDAADVLEMMSGSLLGNDQLSAPQALQVLQQVLDWANQIDLNGLPQASEIIQNTPALAGIEPTAATTHETVTATALRVPIATLDEILRLVGESMIANSQLQESLRQVLLQNKSLYDQNTRFAQLAFELEHLVDVRGLPNYLAGVANSKFDALEMDQYSEMHTLTRRLVETVTDTRQLTQHVEDGLRNIEGLIHQQGRLQKESQDVVMKTRMLPVQNILPRLQRSVRQACRATNKEVELVIMGETTMVDSDILNSIADPLMHILRNAVDHGIEDRKTRRRVDKPNSGRITLSFSREGEYILIRCHDDGAGLDYAAIQRIAVTKGLLEATDHPSQEDLARMIFIAGFSTKEETTQISGRGIGMDAAYNQVLLLKGNMRVESEPHTGTLIEMQLPVTLITLHGVMVKVADQVIALSNRGIEQILHADAGVISGDATQLHYSFNENTYPAYYLEDLLGMLRSDLHVGSVHRPALLVKGDNGKLFVVLAEAILTTQDLVIKQLGQYVPNIIGLEGATILGDGRIAPVINLSGILHVRLEPHYQPLIERGDITGIQSGAPLVMVVDDSLSARRSLSEFMHDVGYRIIAARDGIEAIEMLAAHAPDILLVDMEMPRMNGLELTSYVRANQSTHKVPIIMITSRSTDKHRQEADKAGVNAYLVKPYSEQEVIDQVAAQLTRAYAIR